MEALRHSWLIALKDLRIFAKDRLAMGFALLFPILFVALFSMLYTGDAQDELLELNLATREAEGGISGQVIEALSQVEGMKVAVVDYESARQKVDSGQLNGFLAFPADFTQRIMAGEQAELEVVARSSAINTRAALSGLGRALAGEIGSDSAAARAIVELMVQNGQADPALIDNVLRDFYAARAGAQPTDSAVGLRIEQVGPIPSVKAGNWTVPGYLVMFVFFVAALGAETIVRERDNQTLERLLASSVSRESILGGKFLAAALKGGVQVVVLWGIGALAFGVELGKAPLAVLLVSFLTVVMASAFAVMLAAVVKTPRSAGSAAVLASLVLAPLGGCWWPLFVMPDWMQFLARVTPHAWAVSGFNKLLMFGATLGDVLLEMVVLIAFAVGFGAVAVWRFRARV